MQGTSYPFRTLKEQLDIIYISPHHKTQDSGAPKYQEQWILRYLSPGMKRLEN